MENLTADGKVTKRILKQGTGDLPKQRDNVSVHYEAYLAKTNHKFDSSVDRHVPFTFTLQGGQVISAWEYAIPKMKIGEKAEITWYGETGRPPLVPAKAPLRFEVELLSAWEDADSPHQRLKAADAKRVEGNDYFKKGEVELALHAYRQGREYIINLWNMEAHETVKCRELVVALQSNISMCHVKLKNWDLAIEVSQKVLERDPENIKAFYRLALVCKEKEDFDEGLKYIHQGLEIDPDNADLKSLQTSLIKTQKEHLKQYKGTYKKMFQ
ncbi:hypothetical protein BCR43DRAFT_510382 [Syncephalastrum racemosum]|uniref:peptidylprolyl isomerase n=1 Tax=Syncephalastrum racemosum TaxID=13706 RepID=A0A1X2HUU4_SYNRA|nr:hypothetical protein BCR43DRAFT_510382 [Syncephalastrum racemosum]